MGLRSPATEVIVGFLVGQWCLVQFDRYCQFRFRIGRGSLWWLNEEASELAEDFEKPLRKNFPEQLLFLREFVLVNPLRLPFNSSFKVNGGSLVKVFFRGKSL